MDAVPTPPGSVRVRALRPDDRAKLVELFARLEPQTVYRRYFTFKKKLTEAELDRFTLVDFARDAALVATIGDVAAEQIIAVARYECAERSGVCAQAEVAFVVDDRFQGRGIGRCLFGQLARLARRQGIARFVAEVLPENQPMLAVFERSGFRIHETLADGVVQVTLELPAES